MAVAIVLGWWCGKWVETNITHWKPWTSTIGLLLGCGAAGLAIRRTVREYRAELAAEAALKNPPPPDPEKREAADIPGPSKVAAPDVD
jgi:F0F1-type ATP synthase assembly protein I